MESLESELAAARELEVDALADAIESIGFECTRCGGCCTGYAPDEPGGAPADESDGTSADESDGTPADESDGTPADESGEEPDSEPGGEPSKEPAGSSEPASGDPETGDDREPHTATVFPDEVRELVEATESTHEEADAAYDWRDVARPMPYGLSEDADGQSVGETFEWALATDGCGDCTFYEESDGQGACTVHDARPLICQTYPFSVALGGTSQPMGEAVDAEGMVRAHECEGLGRDISRGDAETLAAALKQRAIRELEEAIGVRDTYDPTAADRTDADLVVFDSEGPKRSDGEPVDG